MDKYEENGSLHEMFIRQAKKTPDAIAVVTVDGCQVTYKELDEMTDLLSAWLRIKGVKLDTSVGIYMERCLPYTVAYIAILKAGGGYMPMDPSYPPTLLQNIIDDARPVAVLVQPDLKESLPETENVLVCDADWLDRVRREVAEYGPLPAAVSVGLDNLAYTVYSSGTTGRPKGIQCPHRGAVFSYLWRSLAYPYQEGEREACNVFFVWEMLRPLLFGATLYIIPDTTIYDPRMLCDFLQKQKITRILFTPSLLEAVLDADNVDIAASFKSLRTVIFCGEVVTIGLLERCIKTMPWVQFVNLYSISESHDVTCSDLSQWYEAEKNNLKNKKFCPVGKLLPGVHVVIVNDDLEPQPVGVAGEIYIGGPTLAIGYLNRPELNAERFIARPAAVPAEVGPRLYKAGDWGYMLSDGSFEICGRCDSMVKIRGYSVETQAVESGLLDIPLVNACVVMVIGAEGEDKHLVAYIVPEGQATKKDIRSELKKRLPFFMIPSYFVFLNSIPVLAASGKLNKKALPSVENTEDDKDQAGRPTTDTERHLESIWADILHLKSVDIHESFFDLGGHSLLATRLLSEVHKSFSLDLTVKDLFDYSTITAMANMVDERLGKSSNKEVAPPVVDLVAEVQNHDQAVLDMDIQLRAFWRSMHYNGRWTQGRILLTGATGFLGSFLLRDLLLHTKSQIFCIVRELPDTTCSERVWSALVQFGILDADSSTSDADRQTLEQSFRSRVSVLAGDVGLVNMGLSEEDYTYLCTEIDHIIHAAAHVNLVYPFKALYGPNVLGTQNVVKFACTSKIKPLQYISTNGVFPSGRTDCSEGDDLSAYPTHLDNGYSQTKWVAEQLVRRVIKRGLPAVIYRLGNLSGDSEAAYWNPQDFNLLMLQGCMSTGTAPDMSWDVEMTPVNFVSHLVVTLTKKICHALGQVFHVINTKPLKSKWLFEWMLAHGYTVKMLPFNQWKERVLSSHKEQGRNALLARLLDLMIKDETFFSSQSTYKQDNLLSVLKTVDLSYPELNTELLKTYFRNLTARNVLPPSRKSTLMSRPLEGRVAIVTGASSGIGASACQHLARAGAHVAMAARREDKLEELKTAIINEGGVAIAVKCDVTVRAQVKSLVEHTEATLGPVDIIVNNAGVMYYTYMKNIKEDEWERQIDINCKGTMNCIGAVLDGMITRGKGHIVNMSSDAGRKGFPGLAVYSGTKFFIEGMSQAMRGELAQTGVKVTCIQPGDVRSELLSHTTDPQAKAEFGSGSDVTVLEPDDIGRAIVYVTTQPPYTAVNEILIEPREAPL